MMMRAFLQEHGLVGLEVGFCKGCHEVFSEQILANYKMMERFDEGARFLEEFGRAEEDTRSSRIPKRTLGPRGSRRGREVLEGLDEAFALLAEIKGS